jgi:putative ABC transport system permease protein
MSSSSGPRSLLVAITVLLLVISLGELYALLVQYQNNSFFRNYVSENSASISVRILGLVVLGLGAGYLAYLSARAKPTSRTGQISRKILSLSPIIAILFGLTLWFSVLSPILGASLLYLELYFDGLLLATSLVMVFRSRITLRMALRNFTRRKANMALVIAGLMIGTAMISGSLVTGDTLTELFTRGAYFGYGHADEVVYARNSTTFGFQGSAYQYFGYNVYQTLSMGLSGNPSAGPDVIGVTPEIIETVSIYDSNKGIVQAGSALIGSFSNASRVLGDFHSASGSVISSTFKDTDAVLNDKAARDLNATIGDTVTLYSAQGLTAQHLNFTVIGIATSDERGSFTQGDDVFVTLNSAQQFTGHPNSVNYIAITNIGGLRGSIQYSQTVALAANQTLNSLYSTTPSTTTSTSIGCKTDPSMVVKPPAIPCAFTEKKISVDSATDGAKSLSQFFLILSSFAILAGIVLILNIFIMLAEERKSEMGMARAVGMRRGQLTRLFLFEGSLYSAGASIVGVLVGIGVAYGILYAIGNIFSAFIPSLNESLVLSSFTINPESLFTAFTAGVLITYVTILLTSWRISKLNIIRAIRNIPEPPQGKRTYTLLLVVGFAMALAGVVAFQASFAAKSALEALGGPSLIIFGAGLILSRFLRNRYAFTLSGFALLVQWAVPSFSFDSPLVSNYSIGAEVFIVGGIIMVVASVIVVMYNTDVPLKALRFLLRKRRTLTAIFKIALSYPENKRFRTAATVAMFALVLFTVSAVAGVQAELNASISQSAKDQSGGYDIATNTAPIANLTSSVIADTTLSNKISAVIPFTTVLLEVVHDSSTSQDFPLTLLVGADPNAPGADNFFTTNSFKMLSMASGYASSTEVWNAVRSNASYVVWSVSFAGNGQPKPGDNLVLGARIAGNLVLKAVKVLGVLRGLFDGIVGVRGLLKDSFKVDSGTLGFVNVAKGLDPVNVANLLKKDLIQLGMQTIVIEVSIEQGERIFLSFFGLFEGYLALGLVVGVAGVGIISIRSVVERRNEIGILRALGFRKKMVLLAFLVESSYIALLGIIIGVSLGVDLAYAFTAQPNSGLSFVIPWTQIIEISVASYALAMLSVLSSARKASRIPPAEALRYTE